jgi:DUF177 domain-containing protein
MEFNVAQLLRESVGASRTCEFSGSCVADDGTLIAAEGTVQLLRTDAGILVSGVLSSTSPIVCSRCLASTEVALSIPIEDEYYPTIDVLTGAMLPPPGEPSALLIDSHHILGLCEAVRQQRILAEPMQPLCRPNCAGLCPTCGADLNAGSCRCDHAELDSRWAALGKLAEIQER